MENRGVELIGLMQLENRGMKEWGLSQDSAFWQELRLTIW